MVARGLILVEGQTEEAFVRDVLGPYLLARGIAPRATIVTTKRVVSGPNFKGGVTSYRQVDKDLQRLLSDGDAIFVTTMLDYYALPDDFPGMHNRPAGPALTRVRHVESEWAGLVGRRNFVPYLSLHEFEALLFTDPRLAGGYLSDDENVAGALVAARASAPTPEDINENRDSCPSRRLKNAHPPYVKLTNGPAIAAQIGVDAMRAACAHFNDWLATLEQKRVSAA